jgi:enoyl-CoA hydratase
MTSDPIVKYSLENDVAHITMDDGKANALSYDMIKAMHQALDRAESEAKAVCLRGRPGKFCAGFDLNEMRRDMASAVALLKTGSPLFTRMLSFPRPVIAACTGHAIAGGALLLLTADYRVGVEGPFKIGLNEVTIGLPLPVMAIEIARAQLHPHFLGLATTFGTLFNPKSARDAGYIHEVATPETLMEVATAHAEASTHLSALAFSESKARLWGELVRHIESTLEEDLGQFERFN